MAKTDFVIPIFIPHDGCPFQCIFCNQNSITGTNSSPGENEVRNIIENYLTTISNRSKRVYIGFYGGSFTGIDRKLQEKYLSIASQYVKSGIINGIRLSTRPDFINDEILSFLKDHGVSQIELGIQSFDDDVLRISKRGYTSIQAIDASILIRRRGFLLGHQMMVGLPGDSWNKTVLSALTSINLNPDMVRVYPLLVMKDTPLAQMTDYKPLSFDEAIERARFLVELYDKNNIKILRVGLHPPKDASNILDGPYHPAFKFVVKSRIWGAFLRKISGCEGRNPDQIFVSEENYDFLIGYKSENTKFLPPKQKIIKSSWIEPDHLLVKFGDKSKFLSRLKFRDDYLYFKISDHLWD